MAITIDYSSSPFTISIPQADLTNVTGTLYELDTDQFRLDVKALEAAAAGMVFQDTHRHNSEVTVAGTTYARTLEFLNSSNSSNVDVYQIQFTPDSQWSVRLSGSNNNIFDVENGILIQNQVQVIAQNSAGLVALNEVLASTQSIEATLNTESLRLMLIEKILRNRMVTDPDTGEMLIYEDNNTDIFLRAPMYEHPDGAQTYRGSGAERRDRLV